MSLCTVGMVSSYPGVSQCDWLWNQSPQAFGYWGNIQMYARAENPDYLLLYNFDFHKYYQPKRQGLKPLIKAALKGQFKGQMKSEAVTPERAISIQLRGVPKENIFFLNREPPLPEVIEKQQADYHHATQYCGYVSGPYDSAPVPEYMPAIWYVNVPFDELAHGSIPAKSRPCSWITSGINRSVNHRQRLDFLQMVRESDVAVDVYGRNLPQWSSSHGPLGNKWFGMAPYYYNLAIENYADNDLYVSEKLWDALLSWCLPIYYGGGAADKLLPPGCFLRLPSLDQKGIDYIRDITANPDTWHEAKDAISEARNIILHELNLLNWLEKKVVSRNQH